MFSRIATYLFLEGLDLVSFRIKKSTVNVLKFQTPEKMTYANSEDPDQTAPEGAVWSGSTLFAIPLSILRNSCIKKQNLVQNSIE